MLANRDNTLAMLQEAIHTLEPVHQKILGFILDGENLRTGTINRLRKKYKLHRKSRKMKLFVDGYEVERNLALVRLHDELRRRGIQKFTDLPFDCQT